MRMQSVLRLFNVLTLYKIGEVYFRLLGTNAAGSRCGQNLKREQTRRWRKQEHHLKMQLRVSAIIFQLFTVIMLEKKRSNYPRIKLEPALGT